MVRVNLIDPKKLTDQHLIAEYNELLMLSSYIGKYPNTDNTPKKYCLGKGHMRFFKNKVLYIKKRHEAIKTEMKKRGFKTNKTINLQDFRKENKHDWEPCGKDLEIAKKRIISKLKSKPNYYRYYGEYKPFSFFIKLLRY